MSDLCGSSGARIGDSVKSDSLVPATGVHADGMVPLAENITMKRLTGADAAGARQDRAARDAPGHGETPDARLRNAAMRTVARTIFLKSPSPFVPLNAA